MTGVVTDAYTLELEEAFNTAGRIAEQLIVLESLAADLDDTPFSVDVAATRRSVTAIGNKLAALRRVDRGETQT